MQISLPPFQYTYINTHTHTHAHKHKILVKDKKGKKATQVIRKILS